MTTPEQIDYIRKQLAAGLSKADIAKTLVTNGWRVSDVNEAFAAVEGVHLPTTSPMPPIPPPMTGNVSTYQPPHQFPPSTPPTAKTSLSRHVIVSLATLIILGVCGATVYAYTQKLGPFARLPYTQENLLSGLLGAASRIQTSSYALSGSLAVGSRDADAAPFTLKVPNEEERKVKYHNDSNRIQDVNTILSALRNSSLKGGSYPTTLEQATASYSRNSYMSRNFSLTDPTSGKKYSYSTTAGGKDFALTVTFSTSDAISAIRKAYNFSATTTSIKGQTVTFTKGSSSYVYLPSTPPKPYFESLGETMRFIPADASGSVALSATSDWTRGSSADWKFNVNVLGDFGDLSFKVNIDALKKDSIYYVRVNNIPSFFGNWLSSAKGEWIKIDTSTISTSTSSGFNELSYVAAQLPKMEKNYKESREKIADILRKVARIADETHLVVFKEAPHSETVDGRLLYRYDIGINKDAIIPYYEKILAEVAQDKMFGSTPPLGDSSTLEYLKSDEFSQSFDYISKNTTITLWVDPKGYPAIFEYAIRVVPPDTAIPLKDKQVNLLWKLVLSDIDKPVTIDAPGESKPIQDLMDEIKKNVNYPNATDAAIKSDLSTVQVQAEIYYGGAGKNSYGTQSWSFGATSCKGGMFKDSTVAKSLSSADSANGSGRVACYAGGSDYLVGAELSSGDWWCIDSSGSSRLEIGKIPSSPLASKTCPR